MNENIFTIAQIVISVLLIIVILMQNKGSGLSEVFGGGESTSYRTKRGIERILSRATIVLVTILVGLSIAILIIN